MMAWQPKWALDNLGEVTRREQKDKGLHRFRCSPSEEVAEWTGLEPATPGVTGRYSDQLNYHSAVVLKFERALRLRASTTRAIYRSMRWGIWRPLGDSNPCYNRERVVS